MTAELITDIEAELREAVRSVIARTPADQVWAKLRDQVGVAGLALPEEYGGAGAGLPVVCAVQEELGRALVPSPMLGSAVLTATALLTGADHPTRERLLPGLASGETTAALAWPGAEGRWDPSAPACTWTAGRLNGEAHYVLDSRAAGPLDGDPADAPDGHAGLLIVAARTDAGVGLFEAPVSGEYRYSVTRHSQASLDASRPLATLRLTDAEARPVNDPAEDLSHALGHARDVACVALAAEQAGAAAHCLERTVEYTKQRVQFGRPIAHFQALQHRMADLHVLVETARSAVWAAARAEDPAELKLRAAVAKVHCSEAFHRTAAEMIQLHGGIAITWEHEAHRYFKRAHGSAQLFGQPHEHLDRIAEEFE
ncbi:acyl-CoA dehydrogenase family protein [Pseudonocardia eucalypti]|uniref:Acyl-CoA dehydrogenase family protein n=1 Tax=Pseudonocardia eucalypti TaxID=648755 RepID=A0ABP9QZ40_9PSEU|nr:alkylation response protein AidB-like acyl-CoA dehydrogenase [Pseudonocardia eucalypti]